MTRRASCDKRPPAPAFLLRIPWDRAQLPTGPQQIGYGSRAGQKSSPNRAISCWSRTVQLARLFQHWARSSVIQNIGGTARLPSRWRRFPSGYIAPDATATARRNKGNAHARICGGSSLERDGRTISVDLFCCPGFRCTAPLGGRGICVPDLFHCSPYIHGWRSSAVRLRFWHSLFCPELHDVSAIDHHPRRTESL